MTEIHTEPSPLSGQTVGVYLGAPAARSLGLDHLDVVTEYVETLYTLRVEDYWDRVSGQPWGTSDGNYAATLYAFRAGFAGLPWDDEVLYGKIGSVGVLVHVSEVITYVEVDKEV